MKTTGSPLRARLLGILLTTALAGSPPLVCAGWDDGDPFNTVASSAVGPGASVARPLSPRACVDAAMTTSGAPLTLPDVVDHALCNNPQTRESWANARYQAALAGQARSAYLPSLNLNASSSRSHNQGGVSRALGGEANYNQTSANLSLSYLLFDFGGREAATEAARQVMLAANATQDATLQSVFLATVQAYFRWYAAQALVVATREAERASLESFKAADARYQVGVATPADKLQAQTAASQATLTRIRSEGEAKTAEGVLTNAMGLDANQPVAIAPPAPATPDARFESNVDQLIAQAKRLRPDLAAGDAQVQAARANIDSARAAGLPSVSLFADHNYNRTGSSDATQGTTVGVSVSIPLFTGFNTTYRTRAAEAQLQAREAQRDRLAQQVALDVWRAYYSLQTESQSVRAAADLLASAEQSAKVALGRYNAGVGGILDLLNAQSTLASARQQNILALYNWRIARVALGQSVGQLDFSMLDASSSSMEEKIK